MKRILLMSFVLLGLITSAWAQRAVSGNVTDAESGDPLPGVAVRVENTSTGTVTDMDGNYRLDVPSADAVLVFSFIGYADKRETVGNRSVIDVRLSEDVEQLEAVVVSALGVQREERSLGYSVQEVKGENLTAVNEQNVSSALAGKVAGVQVVGSSGTALGGSVKIRFRGANSLSDNSPLYVVDGTPISNESFSPANDAIGRDYGNLAQDINPNDIESITVLKGPSATALYGQRGANGVIMITTKKGTKKKGIGVELNQSTTFDKVYILPEYQNEYAGGYNQTFPTFKYDPAVHPASWASFDGHKMLNYAADESWGPRMDGTLVRHWDSWFPGEEFGELRPLTPNPDNVRDFFDTGVTFNTNLALAGGSESSTFRLSLNNISQSGVFPNSKLGKNNVNFNGAIDLTKKLTASTSVNYSLTNGLGRPASGYNGRNPVNSFNQWFQRQLDMDRLRNYRNPDGTYRSWNIRSPMNTRPLYWDNPFYEAYENAPEDSRERVFGNVNLTYKLTDQLSVSGILRSDFYTQQIEEKVASGGLDLDAYSMDLTRGREDNYEFLSQYSNEFGAISVNVNLGANIRKNLYTRSYSATSGGLAVPELYDISSSVDRPVVQSRRAEKEVRSIYGTTTLGYNDFLFVDLAIRNDWSSALPEGNNSYLYPSVSGSFVFSQLLNKADWLSFGKIRAGWGQVGSDIDAYNTIPTYNVNNPYGSSPALGVPTELINENLEPALASSYEFGTDLKFLNNRLGLDVTYYKQENKNQILSLAVPGSSGYTRALVNAGNIVSKGWEAVISGTPIERASLTWDMALNLAYNTSVVEELAEGITNQQLQTYGWGLTLNAREGQEWGALVGNGFQRDPETGMRMVDEDGFYMVERNKELGGILPDLTGGFRNTLRFKSFDLTAFLEFQKGGQFYSITRMFNAYSGLGIETVGNNDRGNPVRDAVADGGGVKTVGVGPGGNVQETYVEAIEYYGSLFGVHENWVYDASYLKLREVRLGYSLPTSFVSRTPFANANFGIIVRNAWLIASNVDGIDPSEIGTGNNGYGFFEGGQLPGVRSLGFNLRLGL